MAARRGQQRVVGRVEGGEGPRAAVLEVYRASYERARQGGGYGGMTPPEALPEGVGTREHAFGLFQMLADRYRAAGLSRRDIWQRAMGIWMELTPFLYLRQDEGVEALTEYVVWKEQTEDGPEAGDEARVDWLRGKVREGLGRAEAVEPGGLIAAARETAGRQRAGASVRIPWLELL